MPATSTENMTTKPTKGRRKTRAGSTRGRGAQAEQRRQWVRACLIEGWSEHRIVRELVAGRARCEETGDMFQCSRSTAYKDLKYWGEFYRDLHSDPDVMERAAGAILERIQAVYRGAMAAGKFHAALRACEKEMLFRGMQHQRWDTRKREDMREERGLEPPMERAAKRLQEMDDDQLLTHRDELLERARRRGLRVVQDG